MSDSERVLRLRPHHGLCVSFFRGKGYSDAFVRHMREVVAALHDGAAVELTDSADDICAACPHNTNGVCDTEQKVRRYDRGVWERTGLHTGDRLDGREFLALVRQEIILPQQRSSVCGDCEWNRLCQACEM